MQLNLFFSFYIHARCIYYVGEPVQDQVLRAMQVLMIDGTHVQDKVNKAV